jgi:transposase InsO family protein
MPDTTPDKEGTMPWKEATPMSERTAFVGEALKAEASLSALCREYGISRKTGYKWLRRYQDEGLKGLEDQPRRPQHSPTQTPSEVEQVIIEARQAHPAWGSRKLKRWLEKRGYRSIPAPSTVTGILARHGLLSTEESGKHTAWQRFEMDKPNDLWQMDFKGYFPLVSGQRCHPLTVLDDHSRFLLGLKACPHETIDIVQGHVISLFREYGLPARMLMDNGKLWGGSPNYPYARFTVWLLRLGIPVSHGRPFHPQTQGKDERLHRTLKAELLKAPHFDPAAGVDTLDDCQQRFDGWRTVYNHERPHHALRLDPPAAHYQPSSRPFPEILPPLVFPPGAIIRTVSLTGEIAFRNKRFHVGVAFGKLPVGLLYDDFNDSRLHVFFNNIRVTTLDPGTGVDFAD